MYSQIKLSSDSGASRERVHCKGTRVDQILGRSKENGETFHRFLLSPHPKIKNAKADELAKVAAQKAPMLVDVFYQELIVKAIREEEEHPRMVHAIASKDWRSPIFAYLNGTYEPPSKPTTDRMNTRMKQYSTGR